MPDCRATGTAAGGKREGWFVRAQITIGPLASNRLQPIRPGANRERPPLSAPRCTRASPFAGCADGLHKQKWLTSANWAAFTAARIRNPGRWLETRPPLQGSDAPLHPGETNLEPLGTPVTVATGVPTRHRSLARSPAGAFASDPCRTSATTLMPAATIQPERRWPMYPVAPVRKTMGL